MTSYVLCLATYQGQFIFVRKVRPSWQYGLYNFPGGKVENESYYVAAEREMREETGVSIIWSYWSKIGEIRTSDSVIHVMKSQVEILERPVTKTSEKVVMFPASTVTSRPSEFIENVPLLIALYNQKGYQTILNYTAEDYYTHG